MITASMQKSACAFARADFFLTMWFIRDKLGL